MRLLIIIDQPHVGHELFNTFQTLLTMIDDIQINIRPTPKVIPDSLAAIENFETQQLANFDRFAAFDQKYDVTELGIPQGAAQSDIILDLRTAPDKIYQPTADITLGICDTAGKPLGHRFFGFDDVAAKRAASTFYIHNDADQVIKSGTMMTMDSWKINQAMLTRLALHNLVQIIKGNMISSGASITYKKTTFAALKYKFEKFRIKQRDRIRRRTQYFETWSVGFTQQTGIDINLNNATMIENPKGRFLADPFVIEHQGKVICFLEDYFFDVRRGKISAFDLTDCTPRDLGLVLDEPFHLSFPFIFWHDDELYMIPESAAACEIRLYKCIDFPMRWEFQHTLMNDISAADTMIFPKDGLWFMLTNIDSADIGHHNSELHGFYASSPLAQEWTPLPGNPLIFDSQKARNGGLLQREGKIYRINQSHDFGFYGKSFTINKITQMTPQIYSEEPIRQILPSQLHGKLSTHHLFMSENYTVFDAITSQKYQP